MPVAPTDVGGPRLMSLAVKGALLATKDLGKNERAVAIAIAAHANHEGKAWPSVATIANYAGCSERTVQRCLTKLVQLGHLAVSKVAGIATRVYRLVAGAGRTGTASAVTNQQGRVTDSASRGDRQGVTGSLEDQSMKDRRAPVSDRFAPQRKQTRAPGCAERGGAAPPMTGGGRRCSRPGHIGQPAGRCIPCRSEAIERRA
ncbi:helix-turn-helix domain-containing protein [Micromonospora chaiyaphumensis]|uniref:helix-turn-helix domain-containing protein n=1 Tax=Micromonospora chaiyaphumensis TaxID=307119 RepID=UPI000B8051DA